MSNVQGQDLSWDDSSEQMEISLLTGNTTNSGVPKSTTEESSSLTEPDTQNDDVFSADNIVPYYEHLHRRNTFRGKKTEIKGQNIASGKVL